MIRVFNADDHPILRKGVTELLTETEGIQWVGSAENGHWKIERYWINVSFLDRGYSVFL